MIEFFMPLKTPPTITHQQGTRTCIQNGKVQYYKNTQLEQTKNMLIQNLFPHKPTTPYLGPVRLITKWCYPITAKTKDGQYKTSKPDTDNSIKLLKDCMTIAGFWKDDSQVASEITEKFHANNTGIYIRVEPIL